MTFEEKLIKIAEREKKVFDAGKAQSDSIFWNTFMSMKSFTYAFYNWNTDVFKPNIDLAFKGDCSRAFYYFNNDKTETVDMIEYLEKCGASLNFSNATGTLSYIFATSRITALPALDFSSITRFDGCFNNCPIETIEKITLKADGSQVFTNTVFNCRASNASDPTLRNLTIEGKIGRDIWFNTCPHLTVESAKSVISCLMDYSGTASEHMYTIYFHEDTWNLLDADGNTSPTGTTWREYVDSLGWNT